MDDDPVLIGIGMGVQSLLLHLFVFFVLFTIACNNNSELCSEDEDNEICH